MENRLVTSPLPAQNNVQERCVHTPSHDIFERCKTIHDLGNACLSIRCEAWYCEMGHKRCVWIFFV